MLNSVDFKDILFIRIIIFVYDGNAISLQDFHFLHFENAMYLNNINYTHDIYLNSNRTGKWNFGNIFFLMCIKSFAFQFEIDFVSDI